MTRKETLQEQLKRQLADLDDLESSTRRFFNTEPWLADAINKKRFDIISHLTRLQEDTQSL